MKKLISAGILLSLFFFMPACSSKSGPTTPSNPTVQSIVVNSSSTMLLIGASETFTATANMSDGTLKAITAGTWSTSNPNVHTVSAAGLVNCLGSGTADIIMTYSGKTGSKTIRGLPNYQGTWPSGTYSISSCTSSGDFYTNNFCGSYSGSGWPIELNLTQTGDVVSGTIYLGSITGTVTGPVATNGQLVLTGQLSYSPFTIDVATAFQSTTPGQITGGLVMNFQAPGYFTGLAQTVCTITSLSRTSPIGNVQSYTGPPVNTSTLPDLARAMRHR